MFLNRIFLREKTDKYFRSWKKMQAMPIRIAVPVVAGEHFVISRRQILENLPET